LLGTHTSKTRAPCFAGALGPPPVEGDPHLHPGAGPGPRGNAQLPAQHLGPLRHGPQAHPPRGAGLPHRLGIEAAPVVLHTPENLPVSDLQLADIAKTRNRKAISPWGRKNRRLYDATVEGLAEGG
jgi:hypothetical protein